MILNSLENDWIIVDAPCQSLLEQCKEKTYVIWKLYKRLLIAYQVFRIIQTCIKIYIVYQHFVATS